MWLRFLRELGEKTDEVDSALLDVPEINQAIQYTKQAAYTRSELDAYEGYWKAVSMEKTLRGTSLVEGRAEVAKNMKAEGLPMELIIKCTNLTSDEINRL
ncbi:MAG: hypothetical protein ACHQUC_02130 [Chlamydiales bacterium]